MQKAIVAQLTHLGKHNVSGLRLALARRRASAKRKPPIAFMKDVALAHF
jgi:hypothetical protein